MFLVSMPKNECLQPLDVTKKMITFLKYGKFFPKNILDEGNEIISTQEKVEEFCKEFNRNISKPETNKTK